MRKSAAKKSPRGAGEKAGGNRSPARTAARTQLSTDVIGETAGEVWKTLADQGPQTLPALKKSLEAPDDLVLLALGWLAREDKLAFDASGRTATVSLR